MRSGELGTCPHYTASRRQNPYLYGHFSTPAFKRVYTRSERLSAGRWFSEPPRQSACDRLGWASMRIQRVKLGSKVGGPTIGLSEECAHIILFIWPLNEQSTKLMAPYWIFFNTTPELPSPSWRRLSAWLLRPSWSAYANSSPRALSRITSPLSTLTSSSAACYAGVRRRSAPPSTVPRCRLPYELSRIPEVLEVHHVAGRRLLPAEGPRARRRAPRPDSAPADRVNAQSVTSTRTTIVLETVKEDPAYRNPKGD